MVYRFHPLDLLHRSPLFLFERLRWLSFPFSASAMAVDACCFGRASRLFLRSAISKMPCPREQSSANIRGVIRHVGRSGWTGNKPSLSLEVILGSFVANDMHKIAEASLSIWDWRLTHWPEALLPEHLKRYLVEVILERFCKLQQYVEIPAPTLK